MPSQQFTANVWQEDEMFIAQCLEVDVASQGDSEDEAMANLREAIELYFEPPMALRKCQLFIHWRSALPLDPLPYREVKRRLEAAGFNEHSQKGSRVKFK